MVTEIEIPAADGKVKAYLLGNRRSSRDGIVLFMDVFGLRPALVEIGEKLADFGYAVLLPDLYYRTGDDGVYDAGETLRDPARLAHVRNLREQTLMQMTMNDARFFADALAERGADGKLAFVGYCMGGGRALCSAAALGNRVSAVASIHGGRLATESADSPHCKLSEIPARVYVGCAGRDESFSSEQSGRFIKAARDVELDCQLENYPGCQHGWAVPDNPVFDAKGSQRHYRRLETLFSEA